MRDLQYRRSFHANTPPFGPNRGLATGRPMRVVLLSYYFPPDQAVGAIRPAKVYAALRAAGHQVSVITARGPVAAGRVPDVTRVRPLPNPREGWLALKAILRGHRPARSVRFDDPVFAQGASKSRRSDRLKRWVSSLIWLPDDRQGFVFPAVAAALWAIRDGADVIYTTAPPFSTHLAGLVLKRITGIRWVAEFRDPWTDNPWKPPHVRSRLSDAVERRMERSCIANADLVVTVSAGIAAALDSKARRLSPERPAALLVRNGIDRIAAPRDANDRKQRLPRTFRVLHVGTFYHDRDPRPVLRGLAQAQAAMEARGMRLHADLVGDCRWYNEVSIEETVRALGLTDSVRFIDWVPHEQAVDLLEKADMLLLLAQGQPAQVPNKLYEYLGTRRPILAFVDDTGESAALLRSVGGHFVITDGSAERAAAALECAAVTMTDTGDERVLQQLTTASQMARLVTALEQGGACGVG